MRKARAARSRLATLKRIAALIGSNLRIVDTRKAWPSIAEFTVDDEVVPLALFVAPIVLSKRGRDGVERRIQNPGADRPIIVPPSSIPVLLGIWEVDEYERVPVPVLAAADAWKREGRMTRFSVFVPLTGLREALNGFVEISNADDEPIACFRPQQFEELVRTLIARAARLPRTRLHDSPLADVEVDEPRRKVILSTFVRATRFASAVVSAYGERCALCGLDLGLVQGAHIYPVSAPGSQDEVFNGLSLCANHHVAFDRHFIFIEPKSRAVKIHPAMKKLAASDPVARKFLGSIRRVLVAPSNRAHRPLDAMFEKRYRYYPENYSWATKPDGSEGEHD